MELKDVPTGELKPNDYNFNEMPKVHLDNLAREVKRRGYVMHHITARMDGDGLVIVDGEHQWRAAVAAGLATVPVQIVEANLPDAIAETYRRNGLRGEANRVKLAQAIMIMMEAAPDEQGVPMSNVRAAKLLGRTEGWLRTTLMYGDLANMAATPGYPDVERVAKMTEKEVRAWMAFADGKGPNPDLVDAEGDEEPTQGDGAGQGAGGGLELSDEEKATKVREGIIKKLGKMSIEERELITKAIARLNRQDRKRAEDEAAGNPQLALA